MESVRKVMIFLAVLSVVLCGGAVFSADFRSGNSIDVPTGTTIRDDLAAAGNSVNVSGTIAGDLLAAGNTVTVSGRVTQSAMLAGGNVTSTSAVGNDLFAAGGQVNVAGAVTEDAWLSGGTVVVQEGARIARDLMVGSGSAQLNGSVGRNLYVGAGSVQINGTVGGNANIESGEISLGPRAVITGNLVYSGDSRIEKAPGARVEGEEIYKPGPPAQRRERPSPFAGLALAFFSLLALYLTGVVVLLLFPFLAAAVAERVLRSPGWSLLWGFVLLAVIPVAAIILMITVVGIPLAFVLLAVYFVLLYVSRVFRGAGHRQLDIPTDGQDRGFAIPFPARWSGNPVIRPLDDRPDPDHRLAGETRRTPPRPRCPGDGGILPKTTGPNPGVGNHRAELPKAGYSLMGAHMLSPLEGEGQG